MAALANEKPPTLASDTQSEAGNTITPRSDPGPDDRSAEVVIQRDDPEDMYPHGFRLWCLAGASIMGVFLISMDQVRT